MFTDDFIFHNINEEIDLYKILDLPITATEIEIKKSYKKLILKYHPDKNKDENASEKFIKIKNAYEKLKNKKKLDNLNKYNDNIENNNLLKIYEIIKILNINFLKINFDKLIKILKKKINFNNFNNFEINDLLNLNNLSNLTLLDINITVNFTLKQYYNNEYITITYDRATKNRFIEDIYPIDKQQIYENEGEIIDIDNVDYYGNIIIKINIFNFIYDKIEYHIINNDLYAKITNNFIKKNIIKLYFLNNKNMEFDLNIINSSNITKNEFGNIYKFENLGLPYYNNPVNQNDLVNINNCELKRGDLYFIVLSN
jgi:curved DNA-binding protein CbpA